MSSDLSLRLADGHQLIDIVSPLERMWGKEPIDFGSSGAPVVVEGIGNDYEYRNGRNTVDMFKSRGVSLC